MGDYICQPQAEVLASIYAGTVPLDDVRISPGRCKDWSSCPPVLLDYGGCEALRSQIERLEVALMGDGVSVDASKAEGMTHVYPILDFLWGPSPGPFDDYFKRVTRF